ARSDTGRGSLEGRGSGDGDVAGLQVHVAGPLVGDLVDGAFPHDGPVAVVERDRGAVVEVPAVFVDAGHGGAAVGGFDEPGGVGVDDGADLGDGWAGDGDGDG